MNYSKLIILIITALLLISLLFLAKILDSRVLEPVDVKIPDTEPTETSQISTEALTLPETTSEPLTETTTEETLPPIIPVPTAPNRPAGSGNNQNHNTGGSVSKPTAPPETQPAVTVPPVIEAPGRGEDELPLIPIG